MRLLGLALFLLAGILGGARAESLGPSAEKVSQETKGVTLIDHAAFDDTARADLPAREDREDERLSHVPVEDEVAGSTPVAVAVAIASWYGSSRRGDPSGDGFIGNTAACGKVLTTESFWTAHRSLSCGTLVELVHAGRSVVVPVEDRGPWIAGREWDITKPVRDALGCSDLCRVEWRVVE